MATQHYTPDFGKVADTELPVFIRQLLVNLGEYCICTIKNSDNEEDKDIFCTMVTNKGTVITYEYNRHCMILNFPKTCKITRNNTIEKSYWSKGGNYRVYEFGKHIVPDEVITQISTAVKKLEDVSVYKPMGDIFGERCDIANYVESLTTVNE